MDQSTDERLYNLLPAIYKIRDLERGDEALRALMGVIQSEFDRLEADIDGLYNDWFIETCAEWVVPYIGDLLGVRNLHSVERAGIFSQRAYVANTLRYRRRKGTAPVLEQLARDVTGWPARAVEFFERLITTQHLNHVRLHSVSTVDLRNANRLELLGSPFEHAAHTAEVRRIASSRGKYNIPNIGLFLWRLQSYFVMQSTPRPVNNPDDGRYRFNPLGYGMPLFNRPRTETEITHLAEEINVPGMLRRRALYDDLEALRQALVDGQPHPESLFLSLDNPAFQVFVGSAVGELTAIPPEEILIYDLSDIPGLANWPRPPTSKTYTSRTRLDNSVASPRPLEVARIISVAVDPETGRLAFPEGVVPERVAVSYAYGYSSDIGGGPYDRRQSIAEPAGLQSWTGTITQHSTLADWMTGGGNTAIITIADSGTYVEAISITMPNGGNLVIQAADKTRPTLRPSTDSADLGELVITGGDGANATLTLNGLWIEGGIQIEANSLGKLILDHCTLVPGRGLNAASQPRRPELPSLIVESPNAALEIDINNSIVGPLRLPEEITSLTVRDSIIHSPLRGGPGRRTPALVSGRLAPFPTLSADTPAVHVQIGNEGPHTAMLAAKPTTLAQARAQLQAAIRAAHSSLAFTATRVITTANRLIILPGTLEAVTVTRVAGDPTSTEMRLSGGPERQVQALLSPALAPFPLLRSPAPALSVTMFDRGPYPINLGPVPTSVTQARNQLYTAIRTAHSDPAFQNALVGSVGDRLVVLPGTEQTWVYFGTTEDDQTTLLELGLFADRPALAADDIGGKPGPAISLERVTVFGSMYVRELAFASESIFTEPVVAQRRQTGCTRFCFVPEGSRVPRRFRCQPDLALVDYAQDLGKASVNRLTAPEREAVLARLTPIFTSVRYGDPGYAQLSLTCAEEIRTGAEDGAEMGVFNHLKQPLREANLRTSLEEYLRFGLAAGIFYVT